MLNDFIHKGDVKSPNIILNISGTLEFQGRSLPENAKEIYNPVFEWMNTYKSEPQKVQISTSN